MPTQNYTITIVQVVDGVYEPLTIGPYYLRKDPYTTNSYTGTHIGDGVWQFSNVDDGFYQLWNASSQVTKWGTKWIGDTSQSLDSLSVANNVDIGGLLHLTTSGIGDALRVEGQVNFYENVNHNYQDLAHVKNIQVSTISEGSAGSGVSFSHQPKWIGTPIETVDLINKSYADANYIPRNGSATQVYTPINFRSIVAFTPSGGYNSPPVCNIAPTSINHITNKNYVDSEISTRISAMASGNFQESPNVIRLIPNGTPITSQVYTTWSTALSYAVPLASSTRHFTILISGEGTSASSIQMGYYNNSYVADYVHFRGLGSDIEIWTDGNIYGFDAGALGRTVIEDLTFHFDDSDQQNTGDFTNIVFKNCKFYGITSAQTFTGCQFQGNNYFDVNALLSFVNCTGNRITSSRTNVAISGTNKINIDYPSKLSIGTCTLTDDGSVLTNNHAFKTGNITLDTATIVDHGGHIYVTPPTGGNLDVTGGVNSTGLYVNGNVQITGDLQLAKKTINSQNDNGKEGEMCFDDQYIYLCLHNDSWVRFNHGGSW